MSLVRRIPKRGFTNIFKKEYAIVYLDRLEAFEAGSVIGPDDLLTKRVVRKLLDGVKILGRGDLGRKLTIKAHGFSAEARRKIEAAGGTAELITAGSQS